MDFLFKHNQEKSEKNSDGNSTCSLKLFYDGITIIYSAVFEFNYQRYGNRKHVTFEHMLEINTNTGDINVKYGIINDGLTNERTFKTTTKTKRNDFSMLHDLIENGYVTNEVCEPKNWDLSLILPKISVYTNSKCPGKLHLESFDDNDFFSSLSTLTFNDFEA